MPHSTIEGPIQILYKPSGSLAFCSALKFLAPRNHNTDKQTSSSKARQYLTLHHITPCCNDSGCHQKATAVLDDTQANGHGYVPIKPYLQTQVSSLQAAIYQLLQQMLYDSTLFNIGYIIFTNNVNHSKKEQLPLVGCLLCIGHFLNIFNINYSSSLDTKPQERDYNLLSQVKKLRIIEINLPKVTG